MTEPLPPRPPLAPGTPPPAPVPGYAPAPGYVPAPGYAPAPGPVGGLGMPPGVLRVAERKSGPSLAVRALYFVLVGWWLTALTASVAWFCMVTLIGLPAGIWLINRIPTVLTLRPRTSYVYAFTDAYGYTHTTEAKIDQPPWPIRGVWFVFVGWWASALVMTLGYALCLLLVTLPIGLMLFNRVPFVASLYRY